MCPDSLQSKLIYVTAWFGLSCVVQSSLEAVVEAVGSLQYALVARFKSGSNF